MRDGTIAVRYVDNQFGKLQNRSFIGIPDIHRCLDIRLKKLLNTVDQI